MNLVSIGKGGKNFKKGKKRDEGETRRDLIFKEDGQGNHKAGSTVFTFFVQNMFLFRTFNFELSFFISVSHWLFFVISLYYIAFIISLFHRVRSSFKNVGRWAVNPPMLRRCCPNRSYSRNNEEKSVD